MPICIIGGSGFYNFLVKPSKIKIDTQFGSVVLYHQMDDEKDIYFLPRHGDEHSIPPHMVNYKANILALHSLKVSRVIATNAVGSLNHSFKPGDYIILDQFIDFVRPLTFFDGDFSIKFASGKVLSGVVHVDMVNHIVLNFMKFFLRFWEKWKICIQLELMQLRSVLDLKHLLRLKPCNALVLMLLA